MTETAITPWQPSPFEGSDLLPVATAMTQRRTDLVGRENIKPEDLTFPILSLLHPLSEAVTGGMEGAKAGHFLLSSTEEVLEPPLRVLLIHHFKSRALFPKSDDDRYIGLESCYSRDGERGSVYGACADCDHKEWHGKQKPLCTLSNCFVALTSRGPAIMRFPPSNKQAVRSVQNALTAWQSSQKNLWEHPAIIKGEIGYKQLATGKQTPYHYQTLRWEQRETVPTEVQEVARALFDQITHAEKTGKFGAQDEKSPDDKVPF